MASKVFEKGSRHRTSSTSMAKTRGACFSALLKEKIMEKKVVLKHGRTQ